MKEHDFIQDNISDAEFEEWLQKQIKQSMVDPPVNFTDAVMERVEKPVSQQQNDPTILFFAAGTIVLGSCTITFSAIFPNIWENFLQYLTLNFWSSTNATIQVFSSITLLCLFFFGLDWLLSKRFKDKNISVA